MINAFSPIGVFDSGIGGLTIAKAIREFMPKEGLIYYGDTKNFPYGSKSPKLIGTYAKNVTNFLINKGVKAIVVACNTACSNALDVIQENIPSSIELFDTINPLVAHLEKEDYKKIGLIATDATIKSNVYMNSIRKKGIDLELIQHQTPLLAPMIEEGKISKSILYDYLNQEKFKNIEALILGCTHYPILKKEIENFYKEKKLEVKLLESASFLAEDIYQRLLGKGGLNNAPFAQEDHFYVSSYSDFFQNKVKIFLGEKILLEEASLVLN